MVLDQNGNSRGSTVTPHTVDGALGRSLLILGCSQRKRVTPGLIPAIDRYDGQFFRVLKKFLGKNRSCELELLIISARFGLLEATAPIPDYDQRMNQQRAAELAPQIADKLKSRFLQHSYQNIFINLGQDYEPAIAGLDELGSAVRASGGIGQRARQMKNWLESLSGKLQHPESLQGRQNARKN